MKEKYGTMEAEWRDPREKADTERVFARKTITCGAAGNQWPERSMIAFAILELADAIRGMKKD